jgi:hypothetical protein
MRVGWTDGSSAVLQYGRTGAVEVRTSWGVECVLWLAGAACPFGGSRPWFVCPLCQDRAAVLCNAGRVFACRRCLDLTYASTRGSVHDRRLERLYRIHRRMGGTGSLLDAPPRPKWILHRTYHRSYSAWSDARLALWGGLIQEETERNERRGWTRAGL